jgi:hypothetical protein
VRTQQKENNEELGITEEEIQSEKPPTEDFYYMVPPNIFGFDLHSKKWGM